jgi:hypothetical protein
MFSSISFVVYGLLLLISAKMQEEFRRFQLEKLARLTGILELLGGFGLLVGLKVNFILLISSGGLALLMLLGFGVRLKIRDGFWLTMPSLIFMLLNIYIFMIALYLD